MLISIGRNRTSMPTCCRAAESALNPSERTRNSSSLSRRMLPRYQPPAPVTEQALQAGVVERLAHPDHVEKGRELVSERADSFAADATLDERVSLDEHVRRRLQQRLASREPLERLPVPGEEGVGDVDLLEAVELGVEQAQVTADVGVLLESALAPAAGVDLGFDDHDWVPGLLDQWSHGGRRR